MRTISMTNEKVVAKVSSALNEMRKKEKFDPQIYIGKTDDFTQSYHRHKKEGYPILLRIAEGDPDQIGELEAKLIKYFLGDNSWKVGNKNEGSAGNPGADKIYICLDSSSSDDELCEYDETSLLGKEFPINLKEK